MLGGTTHKLDGTQKLPPFVLRTQCRRCGEHVPGAGVSPKGWLLHFALLHTDSQVAELATLFNKCVCLDKRPPCPSLAMIQAGPGSRRDPDLEQWGFDIS